MKYEKSLITISRIGMATKGMLYIIMGSLTTLAAINLGGMMSDEKAVFRFIENQYFGSILLTLLSFGLISYFIWRLVQFVSNPEDDVYYDRIANGSSGLFYGIIGVTALLQAIDLMSNSSGSQKKIIRIILEEPWGIYALGVILIGMLVRAIGQFFLIYNKRFFNRINESNLSQIGKKLMLRFGTVGYLARGIVFSIVAYLYTKAMLENSASEIGGIQQVFYLLNDSYLSKSILIIIALGLISYGIFMSLKSKYRIIPSINK